MKAPENTERRRGPPLVAIFSILTIGLASVALLGWILGWPRLTSFKAELIPMAPSTAVLFLLFGVAMGLRAWTPLSRRNFRVSVALGGLGALGALLLFVLSGLNIHWPAEHLGLNINGTVGGAARAHTSPVTAFCFLVASVSFLASLAHAATRPWRATLALVAAGVLLGTCYLFLLTYFFGTPLLHGSEFIPPTLNTLLAFVTLGLALLALAGSLIKPLRRTPGADSSPVFVFALIFLLLALGIVATGYIYYRGQEQHYLAEVERQLAAIADLKVSGLAQWRQDRLADAAIYFKNPSFAALVRRGFEQPEDADTQHQLQDWLGKYPTLTDYNQIGLLDTQGITRLALPAGQPPLPAVVTQRAAELLRSGRVDFQDFYRHEANQRIYLAVLVPLFDERDARRPLGVLVLRIDPETFLYPLIKRWPTSSLTAETLLIRREGNEAVFLNELRFQTNTALSLRVSLDRVTLPAVQAALGREGVMEGVDYREAPVVAALRAIPNSPWTLVARMDTAEMYDPLRVRLWQVVVVIGALLLSAGACVGWAGRLQRVRSYLERAETAEVLRASEARFRTMFEAAPLGVALVDSRTGRLCEVNPQFAEIAGRTRAEMATIDWMSITHPDDVQADLDSMAQLNAGLIPGFKMNKRYRRPDDSYVWINLSVAPIAGADKSHPRHLCMIEDITERKRTEEALLQSRQQLRALSARQATLREEERTRIAREIHDELGQLLTGLKMDLHLAEDLVVDLHDARLHPLLDKLVAATELADATIITVQRIASELRPGVLDRLGLLLALHYEANQFERRSGLRCKLTLPQEELAVPPEAATAFFRIFQETLTNVARHAAAKSVEGAFRADPDQWVLVVQDDGQGIAEAEVTDPRSLGLLGMQERARLLGGTVTFRPAATGGTVVEVCLPRRDAAATIEL